MAEPGKRRVPLRKWLIAIALAVVAVMLTVGLNAGIHGLVSGLQNFVSDCPPKDFPVYSNATFVSWAKNVSTDTGSQCLLEWDTTDSPASVAAFYASSLNQGNWKVTATDDTKGVLSFQRQSGAPMKGTVTLVTQGQQTHIDVELDS
jgi:hypothetical protein